MRESIVKKAYYSIGEVCDLTGLKPHVLRYWETQFDILRPTKNRAGNRVFKPKDIELVLLVKNLLYVQKYTIEGANQKLLDMRKEGELEDEQHEVLGPEFLASMKAELEGLATIMDPSVPFENLPRAGEEENGEAGDGDEEDGEAGEEDQGADGKDEGAGGDVGTEPEPGHTGTIELFEDPE